MIMNYKSVIVIVSILIYVVPCLANEPTKFGGGEYKVGHSQHLTDTKRSKIKLKINENRKIIYSVKNSKILRAINVEFGWPLKSISNDETFGYHGVSNFVDHNGAYPGSLMDYNCGARTYDTTSGYNHSGTDFFLWPFAWNKMDNEEILVVAAAPGVIVAKEDGNFDRNCSWNSELDWNAVYIDHADGSTAWYGHLKNGSLTNKNIGDNVIKGEVLGVVGSSGNSTEPHLHFEVHDSTGSVIDPYQGACNSTNNATLWKNQREYYDTALNELLTTSTAPNFGDGCSPEVVQSKRTFYSGSSIAFSGYFRDELNSTPSSWKISRPDGSVFDTWNHTSNSSHYSASWWYWYWDSFASTEPNGIWNFSINLEGQSYDREFYLVNNCSASVEINEPSGEENIVVASQDTIALGGNYALESGDNAVFLARDSITLNPGTTISSGSRFVAKVNSGICDGN